MTARYDHEQALARSRASRLRVTSPTEIELLGDTWLVLPDVFVPAPTRSTAAHLEMLDLRAGTSFLEIGSGIGVIAIAAARAGCARVVATDINPSAVANTQANAARFGVADRVRCVESDLFAEVGDDRFDVVYWHSNNVWAPVGLELASIHDRAFVDLGYESHGRFLREAARFVAPGGRVLLGISSRATRADLEDLASRAGRRLATVATRTEPEPEGPVTYELLEVVS